MAASLSQQPLHCGVQCSLAGSCIFLLLTHTLQTSSQLVIMLCIAVPDIGQTDQRKHTSILRHSAYIHAASYPNQLTVGMMVQEVPS